MIERYLESKTIEPTLVFNNDGRNKFKLLEHKLSWEWDKVNNDIEITIDGYTFSTKDKVTSNVVWDSGVDSINFANYLQQVKIYEPDSLIGLVLINSPCTGLGCGVNYQIIYDLSTHKQTYFGRFRTGFEFDLYNFNSDNKPDYLSKTFFGRNTKGIDVTRFVLYSKSNNGTFKKFSTQKQKSFWFEHIYTEFHTDLKNEGFKENWIEKINKNDR